MVTQFCLWQFTNGGEVYISCGPNEPHDVATVLIGCEQTLQQALDRVPAGFRPVLRVCSILNLQTGETFQAAAGKYTNYPPYQIVGCTETTAAGFMATCDTAQPPPPPPPPGDGRYCAYCNTNTNDGIIEGPIPPGQPLPDHPGYLAIHCTDTYAAAAEWLRSTCAGEAGKMCIWCNGETGEKRITPESLRLDSPWNFIACTADELARNEFQCPIPDGKDDIPCCDKLAEILKKTTDCKGDASQQCGARINECCDKLDGCIDHIIKKINEKLSKINKSCQQCKAEAGTSAAGTLEYAVACARYAAKSCDAEIECKTSQDNGKPCSGCGSSPCCCKEGSCQPCDDRPQDDKQWCGWCDPTTGIYVVLEQGASPPNANYRQVACDASQAVAMRAAQAACTPITPPGPDDGPVFPSFPTFGSPVCNLDVYGHPQDLGNFFTNAKAVSFNSGILQTVKVASDAIGQSILGLDPRVAAVRGFMAMQMTPFALSGNFADPVAQALGCDNQQWKALYQMESGLAYIEKSIGVDLSEAKRPWRYAKNTLCRNRYLDFEAAKSAYLSNSINFTTMSVMAGMDGYCQDAVRWAVKAGRSKPNQLQLAQLRRRSLISEQQYHTGMRNIGFIEPTVRENLFKTTEQLPTYSDILRMMVRDAGNQGVVDSFDLDHGFTDNFNGQLREWTIAQGIPELAAKYVWRAHWSIPSPTQLFEFWHRLRYKPEFGGEAVLKDNIKKALIQQDILPFWHDHYLAVSFRPLTRVDTRRGFELGTMVRQDVKDAYLDQGYSDNNAEVLTRFAEKMRERATTKHWAIKLWHKLLLTREEAKTKIVFDGIPTVVADIALDQAEHGFINTPISAAFVRGDLSYDRFTSSLTEKGVKAETATKIAISLGYKIVSVPSIKAFKVGRLNRPTAFGRAVAAGMNNDVADKLLDEAESERKDAALAACQRGIRKRYMLGEFDQLEAATKLVMNGTDADYAGEVVTSWNCEKSAIGKAVPAATLCRWLEHGAITPADFVARLVRIGYNPNDASLMVADCLQAISVKRMKQAEKEMKDNEAAQRRAANEAAKQAAAAKRDAEKLLRMAEKALTARKNRAKQLAAAAEKLADKCECGIYNAMESATTAKRRLQDAYGFHVDAALQILLTAAEGWDGGELADFQEHVNAVASGASRESDESDGPVVVGSLSTNGTTSPLGIIEPLT